MKIMKKFFSLVIAFAIVCSLSLTAFAAVPIGEATLETIYTEDSGVITASIYASNITNSSEIKHILNIPNTKVKIVADSLVVSDTVFADWKFEGTTAKKLSQVAKKITMNILSSSSTFSVTDKTLIASYKLTKVDDNLVESDFADNTDDSANALSRSSYKLNNVSTFFGTQNYKYVKSGAKWQDTIDTALPKDDVIKFPATKDNIGGAEADLTTDNTAKKVVIFAKAVDALTGTKDGSANYGITIGGMYYPGYLSVPAGANWSIILVDPDGTLTAGKSYTASVTVDGVTQALTNKVTFE